MAPDGHGADRGEANTPFARDASTFSFIRVNDRCTRLHVRSLHTLAGAQRGSLSAAHSDVRQAMMCSGA